MSNFGKVIIDNLAFGCSCVYICQVKPTPVWPRVIVTISCAGPSSDCLFSPFSLSLHYKVHLFRGTSLSAICGLHVRPSKKCHKCFFFCIGIIALCTRNFSFVSRKLFKCDQKTQHRSNISGAKGQKKNQGRFGFFGLAQGRCDLGQTFWRQKIAQIFPDFSSRLTQNGHLTHSSILTTPAS